MKEGIFEPVKTAGSAAPIVPVLKSNGRIRIYGDFKLTTNQSTEYLQTSAEFAERGARVPFAVPYLLFLLFRLSSESQEQRSRPTSQMPRL